MINEYKGELRKYLDAVAELYRMLLDRGLKILVDLPAAPLINKDTSAIVLTYRNALALVDALSELTRLPSVEAIKIALRSFFELKCTIEYMAEADTQTRAVAYQTQYLIDRVELYKRLDETTDAGKEFKLKWQNDALFGDGQYTSQNTKAAIKNLERQLNRAPYRAPYEFLTANKRANWYTFDNGPRTFKDLCKHLNYEVAYDILYREWSKTVHGVSAYTDSFHALAGQGQMRALRSVVGYQTLVDLGLSLIIDFFLKTAEKLLPHHRARVARFYKNIYKPYRAKYIDPVEIMEGDDHEVP